MKKNGIVSLIMITFLMFFVAGCGYTSSELSPAFETENISKIAFKFGPLEELEVPSEDTEEITEWLETFKIGDIVKRREELPPGTNSVSVRIEYLDGTIVENGLSTIKVDNKEYYLIHADAPDCYMKMYDDVGTSEYSSRNSEMVAKNFLFYLFTSVPGRYEAYEKVTEGKYDPINRDEAFLESDYSVPYTNHYKNRATENCLQNMENWGYFTLVDYLAAQAESQVRLANVSLTSAEDVSGDRDAKGYYYRATLTNEKDGVIEEFTIQGSVGVENMLNGWKVTDFLLSDAEALSIYITGENVYRHGYVAKVTEIEHTPVETPDWGVTLTVKNVTSKGLTLVCEQSGGESIGELFSGSSYSLSRYVEGNWEMIEYLPKDTEVAWTDEAWIIPLEDTVEWDVNWEWLYGELVPGKYRMLKPVMNLAGPGDFTTAMHFVEFDVAE